MILLPLFSTLTGNVVFFCHVPAFLLLQQAMERKRTPPPRLNHRTTPLPSPPVFGEDLTSQLESHLDSTASSSSHSSPVFALEHGLAFMAFGAQAIVQDQFTACFQPKPRRWIEGWSAELPVVVMSWVARYLLLFPYRWVCNPDMLVAEESLRMAFQTFDFLFHTE